MGGQGMAGLGTHQRDTLTPQFSPHRSCHSNQGQVVQSWASVRMHEGGNCNAFPEEPAGNNELVAVRTVCENNTNPSAAQHNTKLPVQNNKQPHTKIFTRLDC